MSQLQLRRFHDITGSITCTEFRAIDADDHTTSITLKPVLSGLPEHKAITEVKRGRRTLVVLDFSAYEKQIGSVALIALGRPPIPIEQFFKRTRHLQGAIGPSRSFVASNDAWYTWAAYPPFPGNDENWFQCYKMDDGLLVARYSFLSPGERGGDNPMALLEIEANHLTIHGELISSLTIMRHIIRHPPPLTYSGL